MVAVVPRGRRFEYKVRAAVVRTTIYTSYDTHIGYIARSSKGLGRLAHTQRIRVRFPSVPLYGPLVQLVERRTVNPYVIGSSPIGAAFLNPEW